MLSINIGKVVKLDAKSSEAYKRLRTNIQFCGQDIKTISVTSCVPNEGKSTIAFNLSVSIAESGKKVLFIDADLRNSVLIGRYKISQQIRGLTHYLSGVNKKEDVVYSTNVENLNVTFSGPVPPNPAELLSSEAFKKLLKGVKEEYDYVIIDTPPLGSVIDSAIIAEECDGAVMVISQGNISYKMAQKTMEQLKKSNCRILGAVLNKVDTESKGYYGSYYGSYYGNSGYYGYGSNGAYDNTALKK